LGTAKDSELAHELPQLPVSLGAASTQPRTL
jgi:hypothetical protein